MIDLYKIGSERTEGKISALVCECYYSLFYVHIYYSDVNWIEDFQESFQ